MTTIVGPWNLCDLGWLTVQNRPKGTKRIVGPSSDQSYWSVYLPTNNIARTPCNTVGPYEAPTILLDLNAMITLRGLNFSIEVK